MENLGTVFARHVLPELPYALAALEPVIDARTMALHHGMHHAAYVRNLNDALAGYARLREQSATWLLLHPDKIPADAKTNVCNSAGGHVNHSLFWRAMAPACGGNPAGALLEALTQDFGSVENFKARFEDAGAKAFGSGWVWLAREKRSGKLAVLTTSGHGNPITQGLYPILVIDVWEHAYYLQHQIRRSAYLESWWSIANWAEAERRFDLSGKLAGETLSEEGDAFSLSPA